MQTIKTLAGLLLLSLLFSCCTPKNYGRATFGHASDRTTGTDLPADRMILYSASMTLEADIPDTAIARVNRLTERYKGYVTETSNTSIHLRIPQASLDEMMEAITQLGKVTSENKSGQDVTDEYTDLGIRLENAQKARQRYLELLTKAATVEEALLVEKELERLNGTIDLLTGRMKGLEEREEYSNLRITVKERKKPGLLGYIGLGLYHSVKWLFVRN